MITSLCGFSYFGCLWILYNDDLVKKKKDRPRVWIWVPEGLVAAPLGDTENLSFSPNFSLSLPFSVSPEIPCLFSFSLGLLRDWWLCTRESETLYFSLFSFFSSFSFSLVFSPLLFLILFLTEVGFGFLRDWSSGPRERVLLSRSISGGQPSLHYSSLVLSSEVMVPLIVMPRRTDFAF